MRFVTRCLIEHSDSFVLFSFLFINFFANYHRLFKIILDRIRSSRLSNQYPIIFFSFFNFHFQNLSRIILFGKRDKSRIKKQSFFSQRNYDDYDYLEEDQDDDEYYLQYFLFFDKSFKVLENRSRLIPSGLSLWRDGS